MKSALWLVFWLVLAGGVRCWNAADVFVGGTVCFVDADCYARMTRARMVAERPARILRHHDFENAPEGTMPHTTMPLDWLLVAAERIIGIGQRLVPAATSARASSLELAGVFLPPLCALLTIAWLWRWAGRDGRAGLPAAVAFALFAISPIMVHATVLGRPDHQALLVPLIAAALGAEWRHLHVSSWRWAVGAGAAWGAALWVSFYEPLILLAAAVTGAAWHDHRRAFSQTRLGGHCVTALVVMGALLIEGWRVTWPGGEWFGRWTAGIGEMSMLRPASPTWLCWFGWGIVLVPVLLAQPGARFWRVVTGVAYAATIWQVRWAPFFGLATLMSLLAVVGGKRLLHSVPAGWRRLVAGTALGVLLAASLWPLARDWEERTTSPARALRQMEAAWLHDVARHLGPGVFVAPWWQSPALVWWSGQPAVAGSSHQSLPGIVETCRFFAATDPAAAAAVLRRRQVQWVVLGDPAQAVAQAAVVLGTPADDQALAFALDRFPRAAPPFLRLEYANPLFKVFRTIHE